MPGGRHLSPSQLGVVARRLYSPDPANLHGSDLCASRPDAGLLQTGMVGSAGAAIERKSYAARPCRSLVEPAFDGDILWLRPLAQALFSCACDNECARARLYFRGVTDDRTTR